MENIQWSNSSLDTLILDDDEKMGQSRAPKKRKAELKRMDKKNTPKKVYRDIEQSMGQCVTQQIQVEKQEFQCIINLNTTVCGHKDKHRRHCSHRHRQRHNHVDSKDDKISSNKINVKKVSPNTTNSLHEGKTFSNSSKANIDDHITPNVTKIKNEDKLQSLANSDCKLSQSDVTKIKIEDKLQSLANYDCKPKQSNVTKIKMEDKLQSLANFDCNTKQSHVSITMDKEIKLEQHLPTKFEDRPVPKCDRRACRHPKSYELRSYRERKYQQMGRKVETPRRQHLDEVKDKRSSHTDIKRRSNHDHSKHMHAKCRHARHGARSCFPQPGHVSALAACSKHAKHEKKLNESKIFSPISSSPLKDNLEQTYEDISDGSLNSVIVEKPKSYKGVKHCDKRHVSKLDTLIKRTKERERKRVEESRCCTDWFTSTPIYNETSSDEFPMSCSDMDISFQSRSTLILDPNKRFGSPSVFEDVHRNSEKEKLSYVRNSETGELSYAQNSEAEKLNYEQNSEMVLSSIGIDVESKMLSFVQNWETGKLSYVQNSETGKLSYVQNSETGKLGYVQNSETGKLSYVQNSETGKLSYVQNSEKGKLSYVQNSETEKSYGQNSQEKLSYKAYSPSSPIQTEDFVFDVQERTYKLLDIKNETVMDIEAYSPIQSQDNFIFEFNMVKKEQCEVCPKREPIL